MTSAEIRKKFLDFFEARGHAIVPSLSLIPENDTTTLFTSAGMQPMVPYLLGAPHPQGKRIVDSQRCFRAQDIEAVGDNRHTTFFEMLGNWSFGDYFKEEQLTWIFTFLTDKKEGIGLDSRRLYVSVFAGDEQIPRDIESVAIWKKLFSVAGIDAADVENAETQGMQGSRIFYYGVEKNWWSLAGVPLAMPAGQPGGPDSEMFYEFPDVVHDPKFGAVCHVNCDCGRYLEIGNNVFMEYIKNEHGSFDSLPAKNVDFGGGLERITMAAQDKSDVFETDLFVSIMEKIPIEDGKIKKILTDHLRASVHLLADGVEPSNKERGYILRRLLRRAIFHAVNVASEQANTPLSEKTSEGWNERTYALIHGVVEKVIETSFFEISSKKSFITSAIDQEMGKFFDLLKSNSELRKVITRDQTSDKKIIGGEDVFRLFSTFGLPPDYIKDEAKKFGLEIDSNGFEIARKKHQEISRAGMEKKFGGHGLLLNTGELKAANEEELKKVTRLHTATHLLQAALRKVLGNEVQQRGSDITAERLRFDFAFSRKLIPKEVAQVESLVNEVVQKSLSMQYKEMPLEDAKKTGAFYFFTEKYPDTVKVYYAGDSLDTAFSKEFCGGPHVSNTSEVGYFKITKEESVAAGVRRIRAMVE